MEDEENIRPDESCNQERREISGTNFFAGEECNNLRKLSPIFYVKAKSVQSRDRC